MMARLSTSTLSDLPPSVRTPAYDHETVGIGMVHLGVGAFHRAHQAVFVDDVLARHGGDWAISGVSLRSPAVRDRLKAQDGLYSVTERGAGSETSRIIGAVKEILVAPEDPQAVLARMSATTTHIVSMTITEKGYLRDPATGVLMTNHPDIQFDLASPNAPKTMHGFVVEALSRRRNAGHGAFTLLSCDNLPANGQALEKVVLDFAKLRDPDLANWIADHATFPSTMVDRIVPATTEDDIQQTSRALGVQDEAPVLCEPFIQWVIEDDFAAARPAWESVGVEMVADVAPFEDMKLRLLNGSHSTLAYLGYLAGYEYIHQAMADADFAKFVCALMDCEATPTLHVPDGTDLEAYKHKLIERFKNPALHHRTWQIAMDGSQKLPQRLLEPIRDHIKSGTSFDRLALAVAGWMRYVTGIDEQGGAIEVSDPLATTLRTIADAHTGDVAAYVRALLGIAEIFGKDLAENDAFANAVTDALSSLYAIGARATVAASGKA